MKKRNKFVLVTGIGLIAGASLYAFRDVKRSYIKRLIYAIECVLDDVNVTSYDSFISEMEMQFNIAVRKEDNKILYYTPFSSLFGRCITSDDILDSGLGCGLCYNLTDLTEQFHQNLRINAVCTARKQEGKSYGL